MAPPPPAAWLKAIKAAAESKLLRCEAAVSEASGVRGARNCNGATIGGVAAGGGAGLRLDQRLAELAHINTTLTRVPCEHFARFYALHQGRRVRKTLTRRERARTE
jgi:hypothetical protein